MTKLQQLYNSIKTLKELGADLPDALLEETNRIEEEIIKNEVIPAISNAIDPIISQIERELILVVEYIPDEPLKVNMTRKRSFKMPENDFTIKSSNQSKQRESSYTISAHTKSSKTNLSVKFPDGTEINDRHASQTLCDTIIKIGVERVKALNIIVNGLNIVSREEDDFYNQQRLNSGYFIMTHSNTKNKKKQIEEMSNRLGLGLKVKIHNPN